MNAKKRSRVRRALRSRMKMRELGVYRLSVNRSLKHIYAQILSPKGDKVLVAASTVEKELRVGATGNIEAASKVGALIADRAKKAGIETVAFDRSGFKFHGRVKAVADAARDKGLRF